MRRRLRPFLFALPLLFSAACGDFLTSEPESVPGWLEALIAQIELEDVTVPPTAIYRYQYAGETVYFRTARCCDVRSIVYDAEGSVICEPSGGVNGGGDGRCPDFFETRTEERLIYLDPRA
jgi:hypothetical protein